MISRDCWVRLAAIVICAGVVTVGASPATAQVGEVQTNRITASDGTFSMSSTRSFAFPSSGRVAWAAAESSSLRLYKFGGLEAPARRPLMSSSPVDRVIPASPRCLVSHDRAEPCSPTR